VSRCRARLINPGRRRRASPLLLRMTILGVERDERRPVSDGLTATQRIRVQDRVFAVIDRRCRVSMFAARAVAAQPLRIFVLYQVTRVLDRCRRACLLRIGGEATMPAAIPSAGRTFAFTTGCFSDFR